MIIAPKPVDEVERLAVLRALCVLDTPPEPFFDEIAEVVRGVLEAPVAQVTLMDTDRLWYKACVGVDLTEMPREISFCSHAMLTDQVTWVEDAREDPRFCGNPVVTGPHQLRFWAGAPIVVSGRRLGTVCAIGFEPKAFDAAQAATLARLALLVSGQLARRSVQKLQASLLASSTDAIICADEDQRIAYWNPAAEAMFGRPAAEVVGQDMALIVPERLRAAHRVGFARLMSGAAPVLLGRTVEVPAVRADGTEFLVELSLAQWREGQGASVGAIIRDVTARKQAEAALERARDEALAADRAKTRFLANMSHEIRTPLNGVVGVTGALRRTPLDERQREMVGIIDESGAVLERLLTDILDLARIESGQLQTEAEPFDPAEAVRQASALFSLKAEAKGLAFAQEFTDDLPRIVLGDSLRFKQIVLNLLSNAVKFTERGGLSVRVARDAADAGVLTVVVGDTGVGFAPEQAERLFDRFGQADASVTRRYGGSGLGLPIARELALAMGGTLHAASEPGQGSVFTLTLPIVVPAESGAVSPAPALEVAQDRPLRILLAEDNATNRRVIRLILDAAGCDLVEVEDGLAALEACTVSVFDVVLMDVQMPVMDGLTAIREIRALERRTDGRRTPILVVSANASRGDVAASLDAGADDHVSKPIRAEALFAAVDKALADSSLEVVQAA